MATDGELQLGKIARTQSGNYSVQAFNAKGTVNASFFLNVLCECLWRRRVLVLSLVFPRPFFSIFSSPSLPSPFFYLTLIPMWHFLSFLFHIYFIYLFIFYLFFILFLPFLPCPASTSNHRSESLL